MCIENQNLSGEQKPKLKLAELTDAEYFLFDELVSMSDRELAKSVVLDIWPDGPKASEERLKLYLEATELSQDEDDFEQRVLAVHALLADAPRA